MSAVISALGRIFRVKFQPTSLDDFVYIEEVAKQIYDEDLNCECSLNSFKDTVHPCDA